MKRIGPVPCSHRHCGAERPRPCLHWLPLVVMMAALVFGTVFAGAVHGACVPDGSGSMVCSGDESSGIDVTGTGYVPPVTTLYVQDLDGPINPSAGNPGISLTNGTSLNSAVYSLSSRPIVTRPAA